MNETNSSKKLDSLLASVQKEGQLEEFIYGVTNRSKRGFFQKINDFLIDHSGISAKEKSYFFELLATMIRAGISLNKSIQILTTRTDNLHLRRVAATISYELEHGRSLSQALDRFPDVFEETQRAIIRSSEAVGNLEQILFKVAQTLTKRSEFQARLVGVLIYPAAVLVTLIIGGAVMLVVVVPKIKDIFDDSDVKLPIFTRILLSGSVFFTQYWWMLLIGILLAIVGFHTYVSTNEGRFAWDFKKLRIPLIGNLLRKIIVMRFVDTLGILIESGLPINKSLEFVANAVGNEVYRVKTYEALAGVQSGIPLSNALSTAPFLFSETVTNMIAVGEKSASMGEISQKIGNHFEKEIDHTLQTMTTILGPILILIIGITVAFFALAVLAPFFSLSQVMQ